MNPEAPAAVRPFTRGARAFLTHVVEERRRHAIPLNANALAERICAGALGLLFPHFAPASRGEDGDTVADEAEALMGTLADFLHQMGRDRSHAEAIAEQFLERLGSVGQVLLADAQSTADADPAAHTLDEVILAYPGFLALASYRLARLLLDLDVPLLPRLITESAHRATGIDIHPGATLGRSIAIDHGTGIVIGETAEVGDGVRIYQGVTLGALSVRKDKAGKKRHPTIEAGVTIYANATILGGETVVGSGSVIGGNVWLTHSVPAGSIVTCSDAIERQAPQDAHDLEFYI
jgi:serine O-acetyltransferase